MISILAKILEKYTIEIIPTLPMFMRTPLYLNILKLRKVKDRLRLDVTKKNPTFEDRLDYALDSRANLNNSGEKLHNFNSNVVLEEIKAGPVIIYKFSLSFTKPFVIILEKDIIYKIFSFSYNEQYLNFLVYNVL